MGAQVPRALRGVEAKPCGLQSGGEPSAWDEVQHPSRAGGLEMVSSWPFQTLPGLVACWEQAEGLALAFLTREDIEAQRIE